MSHDHWHGGLLEQGFTVGQLGHVIFAGLAKLRGTRHPVACTDAEKR